MTRSTAEGLWTALCRAWLAAEDAPLPEERREEAAARHPDPLRRPVARELAWQR